MLGAGRRIATVPAPEPSLGRRLGRALAGGAVLILSGATFRYAVSPWGDSAPALPGLALVAAVAGLMMWAGSSIVVQAVFPSPGGPRAGRLTTRLVVGAATIGSVVLGVLLAAEAMN